MVAIRKTFNGYLTNVILQKKIDKKIRFKIFKNIVWQIMFWEFHLI